MRIAYLSCVMPPYPGGIGVAASGMAAEMARRGHEVHVFAPRFRHPERSEGSRANARTFVRDSSASGLRMTIHELCPWFHFGNAAFLPQLFWRLRGFDIIHVLYPFYGVAELVPLLKRTTRAKIVIHHMMDAVAPGLRGRFFKWHTQHLAPRIFRAADRVLVLSEDYARNSAVANLGVKWEVVPHGIDIEKFCPAVMVRKPVWVKSMSQNDLTHTPYRHLNPNPFHIILFVGGLDRAHYFKGVPVLIDACRILKDRGVKFQCQIIGNGEMRKEYEQYARELGIMNYESGVEFLGLVAHDQLPSYYQRATICVVPSTEPIECFSIVAAEAQACGIPAIVTNFPGVRVTIEHGKTGFVIPSSNAQALADRIQWFIEHTDEARAMGAAGRERVEQMYSWKVVGDRLEGLYKELL